MTSLQLVLFSQNEKTFGKYCSEYLQIGFLWNGKKEYPRPQCVICGYILANEIMRPNKLHRNNIDTNHPEIMNKLFEFHKRKTKIFNILVQLTKKLMFCISA